MQDFILAEFQGTYRAPHPDGIKDANMTKNFHVKVKMKRESLRAPGLNGLFATYYKSRLRTLYPDMIDTYMYDLVQATELDGKVIDNPKALSYEGLLKYVAKKMYPINVTLYSPNELRNQIVLYEEDHTGQQTLEGILTKHRGSELKTAAELQDVDDLIVVVSPAPSVGELLAGGKSKAK